MSSSIDLKSIEKRAFRATYQDGLWDIHYGLIVIFMSVFIYRPQSGYSFRNILLSTVGITISLALFLAGKKFITTPRLGQVKFGEIRQHKKRTLSIILAVFVLFQVLLVGFTAFSGVNETAGQWLQTLLGDRSRSLLIVSSIGSLIVGSSMLVSAYFTDFTRGYYIAILMALAVFLMIFLNQPLLPILIGSVILLPGLVLFVIFLRRYPLTASGTDHD